MSSASIPQQMKAVLVKDGKGPAENLYIGDYETPQPKEDEILVKISHFALNRMDILQREGKYPLPPMASKDILGVEFSGKIVKVGSTLEGGEYSLGQEVFGLTYGGAYCQYIVVKPHTLFAKPSHISMVEAAAIPETFLTAFQALILIGKMQKGENVLIHAGASGVGVAANQIANLLGAKKVFTTAGSEEKCKFLVDGLKNGATKAINYKTEDFSKVIKDVDPSGVSVILDFIGKDYFHKNMSIIAPDARLVYLAFMSGAKVPEVDLSIILYKRLSILASTLRARSVEYQGNLVKRFKEEALPFIDSGEMKVVVHDVLDWKEIRKAHDLMQANANIGKIVMEVTDF